MLMGRKTGVTVKNKFPSMGFRVQVVILSTTARRGGDRKDQEQRNEEKVRKIKQKRETKRGEKCETEKKG